jgi:glycosyltransferase involved in cell wall biosynthesis
MDILYDYQMFAIQRFGGISRIFIELMRELSQDSTCDIHWHRGLKTDDYDVSSFQSRLKRYFTLSPSFPYSQEPWLQAKINQYTFQWFNQSFSGPYDIYHPTYYDAAPLDWANSKRLAVTICDMIPEKLLSHELKFKDIIQAKKTLVERADIIFSISESTKQDLIDLLAVDAEKIKVTPLASRMTEIAGVADLPPEALEKPYFLYVGTRSRYKNFNLLVQAFSQNDWFKENFQVICFGGSTEFLKPEIKYQNDHGVADNFVYLRGNDALLKGLYEQAQALIYPSLYEGFGLPPLEAMSCGCPVVCGRTSSLPEVLGPAATFVEDLSSPEAFAAAMTQVVKDSTYRQRAIQAGRSQAEAFSWRRTAELTLMGYRSIL